MLRNVLMALPLIAATAANSTPAKQPYDCETALKEARVLRNSVNTLSQLIKDNQLIGPKPGRSVLGGGVFRRYFEIDTVSDLHTAKMGLSTAYDNHLVVMARNRCGINLD